jgi:hypothetical protein
MSTWRTKPLLATVYNFLYRARRGALLEKKKAYHRIEAEEERGAGKSLFGRSYGSKYHWNTTCPCCNDADETDGHTLIACPVTSKHFRQNLREEVIEILREHLDETSHDALQRLPAWIACYDDNIHADRAICADNAEHDLLKQIDDYDKHLGTLGYVPLALVSWLSGLQWKGESGYKHALTAALRSVQHLLADRAHKTWNHRCKLFEAQWRTEVKKRKADEEEAKTKKAEEEKKRKAEAELKQLADAAAARGAADARRQRGRAGRRGQHEARHEQLHRDQQQSSTQPPNTALPHTRSTTVTTLTTNSSDTTNAQQQQQTRRAKQTFNYIDLDDPNRE